MILEFLTISPSYQYKELYLQHIHEMINIELSVGDTYNHLFEKLTTFFANRPEDEKQVATDFIEYNKSIAKQSDFDCIVCDDEIAYAAFNLKKIASMTKTEQDAQWIKDQRSKITKAYCQLLTIILNQNLEERATRKYDFDAEISTTGNHLEFTIRLAATHEQTQKFEYWLLSDIFTEYMFTGIDKRRTAEKVKKCLSVISSAKKAILECIKINES